MREEEPGRVAGGRLRGPQREVWVGGGELVAVFTPAQQPEEGADAFLSVPLTSLWYLDQPGIAPQPEASRTTGGELLQAPPAHPQGQAAA